MTTAVDSIAIPAVILAAGAGRRLGGIAKALLKAATGESFLAAIQRTAKLASVARAVVVIGPPYEQICTVEAARLALPVTHNPDPSRGMASSVELGFAYVAAHWPEAPAALLWPVDHAHVQPATVSQIVASCEPQRIVIPTYRGRGGHPAGFGRALWPALMCCQEQPQGARSVLQALAAKTPENLTRIEFDDMGVVADVDTPRDAARVHVHSS